MQQIIVINENIEWKIDPITLSKQGLKEMINPLKSQHKISKSEQIMLVAAAKTDRDNLKLIQNRLNTTNTRVLSSISLPNVCQVPLNGANFEYKKTL